jgi:anti-sigma factor RsiW
MSDSQNQCETFDELLIRYVDGEASEEESQELRRHVAECDRCREELRAHQKLRNLAVALGPIEPPEELWDEYVQGVYNRMERGIGWVLLVVGAVAAALVGAWLYATEFLLAGEAPVVLKVGLTAVIVGFVVLLVSVYRQRHREARTDRYREIIR